MANTSGIDATAAPTTAHCAVLPDQRSFERAHAAGEPGTLLHLDLEHPEPLDPASADHVEAVVAARLRAVLRPCDPLVRLDDGRFVALVRHRPPTDPAEVAERLAIAVGQPIHLPDGTPVAGVALAVAVTEPATDRAQVPVG